MFNWTPAKQHRVLTLIHYAQVAGAIAVCILGIARLATRNTSRPMSRMDVWGITVAVKSLVILSYVILTEKVEKLRRWASLRAYLVLSVIEFAFWIALLAITGMSISKFCDGANCGLGVVVMLLAIALAGITSIATVISWNERRHYKRTGQHPFEGHYMNQGSRTSTQEMTYPNGYASKV